MAFLEVDKVSSGYGDMEVLHNVSIHLHSDETVTIIGPNGAGKSTLLKTIMGYLIPTQGHISLNQRDVTSLRPDEKVRQGIGYVPQLDNVFPSLTISETLEMGGFTESSEQVKKRTQDAYQLFPILAEKKYQKAATMSGGQKQMLALARALMTDPSCLMLDEPSAGLAPNAARTVFDKIAQIHQLGTAILIVEQDAYQSLKISDRCYVLVAGCNEHEGLADTILRDEEIKEAYLGG